MSGSTGQTAEVSPATPSDTNPASQPGTGAQAADSASAAAAAAPTARPEASAPEPAPVSACENCATPLTGPYCAQCGQKQGHSSHSVWHFASEMAEDLTHADSRLWQTLRALLLRPGALTREFLDGHRVRYLPPLRLYLVISLLYFVLPALTPQPHQTYVQIAPGGIAHGFRAVAPQPGATLVTPELASQMCQMRPAPFHEFLARFGPLEGPLEQTLLDSCRKDYLDGGNALQESMQHNTERGMFLFLPLLALLAGLLYRHPRHHYVEHLLFFVHNQCFLFLVLAVRRLLAMATPAALQSVDGLLGLAVFVYAAWYMYRAMRRVYGQGRLLTLAKYATLAFFYMLTGVTGIVLTVGYSWLTL